MLSRVQHLSYQQQEEQREDLITTARGATGGPNHRTSSATIIIRVSFLLPGPATLTSITSVFKYMILLTFFVGLITHLFYKHFSKSINKQVRSKVHWIIDIIIYILL
jgi:hypothetical protein